MKNPTSPQETPMKTQITEVLESQDPALGMTATAAERLRDAIEAASLTDDRALAAHDLLHHRVVFGRAF
jgi:hypothetical protein